MTKRNNKLLIFTFATIFLMVTGCTITLTRNQYYIYPDPFLKKSGTNGSNIDQAMMLNDRHEPNR